MREVFFEEVAVAGRLLRRVGFAADAVDVGGGNPYGLEEQFTGVAVVALRVARAHATFVHPIEADAVPVDAAARDFGPAFKHRLRGAAAGKG